MATYSPLINGESIAINNCNNRIMYFILFIIMALQACCVAYMVMLTKIAENINLFDFNKTETTEYIDKFKIIIDSVCTTMIKC
jgi:hypothetical protein